MIPNASGVGTMTREDLKCPDTSKVERQVLVCRHYETYACAVHELKTMRVCQ